MACMDHECLKCDHWWADNLRAAECPVCGYSEVTNWFDESPEPEGHPDYQERNETWDWEDEKE